MPVYAVNHLSKAIFELDRLDEPLWHLQELDGSAAPPASTDILVRILLIDKKAGDLHVFDNLLLGVRDGHALVLTSDGRHPSRLVNALLEGKMVFHDPLEVILIADGTDHHGPCAEVRVHLRIGYHLHPPVEDGRGELPSYEARLRLVVWMDRDEQACTEELRSCGGDQHLLSRVDVPELDGVELRHAVLVVDLGVRESRATACAPIHRKMTLVCQALVVHANERNLRELAVVFGVRLVIDTRVHALAEYLELPGHLVYVLLGELMAHADELLPGHIGRPDPLDLLDPHLDGCAIYIETEREEHIAASEPFVPRREVYDSIAVGVAQVQRPRGVPWGIVNAEYLLVGVRVETVYLPLLPLGVPLGLALPPIILGHGFPHKRVGVDKGS